MGAGRIMVRRQDTVMETGTVTVTAVRTGIAEGRARIGRSQQKAPLTQGERRFF
jgi:hypothetical protein